MVMVFLFVVLVLEVFDDDSDVVIFVVIDVCMGEFYVVCYCCDGLGGLIVLDDECVVIVELL